MPTVNLMPRKKMIATKKPTVKKPAAKTAPAPKVAAPAGPGRKPGKIAQFVLAQDARVSAPEIVKLAKAAGIDVTAHRVHNIRWRAQQKGKAKAAAKAVQTAKTVKVKAKPTKVAPPKAKAPPAKAAKRAKPATKAAYVLSFPPATPAADIVAAGKAKGIKLSTAHVYAIRTAAKAKAKKGKGASAPVKVKPAKVQPAARRAAPRPAPSAPTPSAISGISPLDLAYAVGRLVAEGRTTAAEVADLAAERTVRIQFLEAHLAALKTGSVPLVDLLKIAKSTKPVKASAKPGPRSTSKTSKPKATKGKVSTRRDGRSFTTTAKVVAARKWQGQYMGHLRQIPEAEKAKFKAIAKEKGIPLAVAELKKRLGKK